VTASLRIVLDVNIWVANLLASAKGRRETAAQRLISIVSQGRWDNRDVQLIVSLEMLDTLQTVLERIGAGSATAEAYCAAVKDIMQSGPDRLDPYLLLGDGREQFAMSDVEDAGVLATAFAAKASLLVTDNLKDFKTDDALRVDTQIIGAASRARQLYALRHQRSGIDLLVAHPFDAMSWIDRRLAIEADTISTDLVAAAANRL
jgi:predicted nucleic acid-binding protein